MDQTSQSWKFRDSVESQPVFARSCGQVTVYNQREQSFLIIERIYLVLCVSAEPSHYRIIKYLRAKKIDLIWLKCCHLGHNNYIPTVNFKNAEHLIHNNKLEVYQNQIQDEPIPFLSANAGLRWHNR